MQLAPFTISADQQAEIEKIAAGITFETISSLGLAEVREISDTILASVGANLTELTPTPEVRQKIDPAYKRLVNIYLAIKLKLQQETSMIFSSLLGQRALAIHTSILTVWMLDQRIAGVPYPEALSQASNHLL